MPIIAPGGMHFGTDPGSSSQVMPPLLLLQEVTCYNVLWMLARDAESIRSNSMEVLSPWTLLRHTMQITVHGDQLTGIKTHALYIGRCSVQEIMSSGNRVWTSICTC